MAKVSNAMLPHEVKAAKEALLKRILNGCIYNKEVVSGKRGELHIALFKFIDFVFACYKEGNSKAAENAIDEGSEIFQELYPGTTIDDFAKFIVFRKMNRKLASDILEDSDTPDKLQELLIYNMDMLK